MTFMNIALNALLVWVSVSIFTFLTFWVFDYIATTQYLTSENLKGLGRRVPWMFLWSFLWPVVLILAIGVFYHFIKPLKNLNPLRACTAAWKFWKNSGY